MVSIRPKYVGNRWRHFNSVHKRSFTANIMGQYHPRHSRPNSISTKNNSSTSVYTTKQSFCMHSNHVSGKRLLSSTHRSAVCPTAGQRLRLLSLILLGTSEIRWAIYSWAELPFAAVWDPKLVSQSCCYVKSGYILYV